MAIFYYNVLFGSVQRLTQNIEYLLNQESRDSSKTCQLHRKHSHYLNFVFTIAYFFLYLFKIKKYIVKMKLFRGKLANDCCRARSSSYYYRVNASVIIWPGTLLLSKLLLTNIYLKHYSYYFNNKYTPSKLIFLPVASFLIYYFIFFWSMLYERMSLLGWSLL